MGRGKTVSDEDLLDRLLAAVKAAGPGELTFSSASKVVGLSAATLVQRFGSRDAMVEAILLRAWDRLDAATAAADAQLPVNPVGAISLLMQLMPTEEAEYNATDGLLLLREDLRNPILRARGRAWGVYLAQALGRRLTNQAADAERLGLQMSCVWQGALIWWAFKRDTGPKAAIEAMLNDWCRSVGQMT